MKHRVCILLFVLSIPITVLGHDVQVFTPDPGGVAQGDTIVCVLIPETPVASVRLVLDRGGEAALEFPIYPLRIAPQFSVFVGLLGIPDSFPPGTRRLIVRGVDDGGSFREEISITVMETNFIEERIPLNATMTSLRRDENERKNRESQKMTEILLHSDPDSRFHLTRFQFPVESFYYTSFFGDRRIYEYDDGSKAYHTHTGLDLAAPTGTPVYACGAGRVVLAADRLLTGKTVVIEHLPGLYSLYYHLDSIAVERTRLVRKGQSIGTVGATGLVTGAHLHWEIRLAGVPINPLQFIGQGLIDKKRILSTIMQAQSDERR